jgi:hypothetical protein
MTVNYTELTALSTWMLASRQDCETSLIFGRENDDKWQGCNGLNAIRAVLETGVPPRLTPIKWYWRGESNTLERGSQPSRGYPPLTPA